MPFSATPTSPPGGSSAHGVDVTAVPSNWLTRHASLLPRGSRVLDLACGYGRNARWLAAQGHRVLAVDRDNEALAALNALAKLDGTGSIETLQADLENTAWPLEGQHFTAVVVTRYLHRPLFPMILTSVEPSGWLIYETFMRGNEQFGRPSRPEFLLEPSELRQRVAQESWKILDSFEGYLMHPGPAMIQAICARHVKDHGPLHNAC